ncbi:MAG TPA: hypothetical protein VMA83_00875 [Solirubrobacteraceae bacterium]|nr:hypothetical protein [Solirubrobacteraceae bacterium]
MSTQTEVVQPPPAEARAPAASVASRLRVTRRGIQIALGCIWLLDGILQFQSFMYTHRFLTVIVEPTAEGQPGFIREPILTFAHFYAHDMTLWNTLSAEIQVAIGLGLIVSRKSVKVALLFSYGWAFVVWWFGEGFATLFSGAPVSPLMGAPGAVLVYGLIGLLVWPTKREGTRSAADGGLLGDVGARVIWSVIWLEAAVLWLLNVDRSKNAISEQLKGMAEASPHWISTHDESLSHSLAGHGTTVATGLAVLSVLIAAGVWTRLRVPTLVVAMVLALAYWYFGQALGGPFWAGEATDVNTGPLLVLLALTLWPARPSRQRSTERSAQAAERRLSTA